MRFWYPLTHAMPESRHWLWGVISWNPTWYAGYPEIQFYPPGTTLLGIFLHYLTLGQLSPETIWNFIPAIAFALPLFTFYAFLRYTLAPLGILPSVTGGLVAAFLAISLKPMWGGIDGVVIGLMGERLAFGFAPIVLLTGWWLVEKPSIKRLALASITLAALLLLHPFHAPALVAAVALYALARFHWRTPSTMPIFTRLAQQISWIVLWVLISIGLVAWWVIPLLGHYTPNAAALVRATSAQVVSWFDASKVEWLWLASLVSLPLLAYQHPRVKSTVGILAILVPLIVGGILFNDQILLARFNISFLDPIRFIAEYYLALILLTGCAIAAVTSRFLWRTPWIAALCTIVLASAMTFYIPNAWADLNDKLAVHPMSKLNSMLQHPAFTGYWETLRNDPAEGRIFFASNYLQLTSDDGVVTPTTVNSLAPYLIGREIIGGTFSHWSPVARWLWVGDPFAKVLPAQVESGDNRHIFGKPWDEISADEIADNLTKLNVVTIVTSVNDNKAIERFNSSPNFAHYWQNDYFTIYHLVSNPGDWITSTNATTSLLERNGLQWRIHIERSEANAILAPKMAYYPLWQAETNGQPIPLTSNANSLQEIILPKGENYIVTISYQEGIYEWTGLLITLATIAALGYALWHQRSRPRA